MKVIYFVSKCILHYSKKSLFKQYNSHHTEPLQHILALMKRPGIPVCLDLQRYDVIVASHATSDVLLKRPIDAIEHYR